SGQHLLGVLAADAALRQPAQQGVVIPPDFASHEEDNLLAVYCMKLHVLPSLLCRSIPSASSIHPPSLAHRTSSCRIPHA
uniref:Uncharacterized protein n=1 Tax=Oryza brachyantha TaxID=4533 RepID=J3L530_ORYBR